MSLFVLLAVVFFFSIIQSLFGVGVLVFGTPTLLLLGVPFQETLGILLPCSLVINGLQLRTDGAHVTLKRNFVYFLFPFVAIGLIGVLWLEESFQPDFAIGGLLLLTAGIRFSPYLTQMVQKICKKSLGLAMPLLGLIHGTTNMGGGLLTVLVSSLYREKKIVRANVAFGYLVMASSQCAVLAFFRLEVFTLASFVAASVAGATYLGLGNRIFDRVSNQVFQVGLTAMIFLFGLILVWDASH